MCGGERTGRHRRRAAGRSRGGRGRAGLRRDHPEPAGRRGRGPGTAGTPRRERRTVGGWCFADHLGPAPVTGTAGLDIGPHPHIGPQTVTWLLAGEVLHRDSLGTEQPIRAGQLNLMTAGHGVAHSEETTGHYRGVLHGVQLWVAQPEETRHGAPAFEHHAELPRVELEHAVVDRAGRQLHRGTSPVRHDARWSGWDGALRPGRSAWPLDPAFEYALAVLDGQAGRGPAGPAGAVGLSRPRPRPGRAVRPRPPARCCWAASRSPSPS